MSRFSGYDPVLVAEDRPTGLCDRCKREDALKRTWDGEWLCSECYEKEQL